jgi:hypothetical protein
MLYFRTEGVCIMGKQHDAIQRDKGRSTIHYKDSNMATLYTWHYSMLLPTTSLRKKMTLNEKRKMTCTRVLRTSQKSC